jgi:hypothetical protein
VISSVMQNDPIKHVLISSAVFVVLAIPINLETASVVERGAFVARGRKLCSSLAQYIVGLVAQISTETRLHIGPAVLRYGKKIL